MYLKGSSFRPCADTANGAIQISRFRSRWQEKFQISSLSSSGSLLKHVNVRSVVGT
jgi:hypothetical protein